MAAVADLRVAAIHVDELHVHPLDVGIEARRRKCADGAASPGRSDTGKLCSRPSSQRTRTFMDTATLLSQLRTMTSGSGSSTLGPLERRAAGQWKPQEAPMGPSGLPTTRS